MKKLYVLFLCLFSGITLFAGNIRITNNGKPEAVIVLPASAGEAADFAAEELQLWIKEISGATLPIVPPGKNGGVQIVLALNPAGMEKDLDAIGTTDGFAIRTTGKTITIAATRGTGLIRGVHALLFNNTDIIWARPDVKFGTIFTKNPTLVFTETDFISVPKFTQRGFQYSNLFIPATELWQVRNNSSFSTYNVVNGKRQSHLFDQFFIFNGHHNIVGYYMPEKKYYDKHPEYYNLINGKRKRPSENGHLQTGLCLSNEECFQEWQKNFMAKVEEYKNGYDVFGVVLEDTFDSCECPGCTAPIKLANDKVITIKDKNYRSTQFFMWLNRIAAELHKRYPDKKIKTNAYYQTEAAPSCDVHPIIQVNFAPIFRDSKYAIDHPKNKESCDKFLAWSKTGTDLCFRDYYGLVAEFPRPMDAIAIADWQFVNSKYNVKRTMSEMINDSNGRTYVHSQGPHIWDQNMPYFCVLCNASWDPYKGVEYYRQIFFRRVYGDAAKEISEYYAILENAWKKSPGVSNWHESPYGSWAKAVIYAPELENKLRALLRKAATKKMHPNARIMLERLTASFERMIKCETAKLQAAYTSKVPEFDPDFKTGAWKETELNSVFTPYIAGTAKVRTEVRMLHDEKNLYVGVRCFDTVSGDKVFAPSAKRDTWTGGNMLEFLIGNARNKRIQLMVNPKGVIMDKLEKESSWEGFFDIPVKYNADGWSVMVTIPFSLLGYDKTPDHIRLNILRYYFITQSNRQTLFWQRYDMPVDAVLAYPTIKLLKKDEKYQKPLTAGEKAMQGKAPETLVYNDPQAWKLASNTIFSDGAFISTGKAEMRGKEIIAIDPEKSYTITLSAKQLAGNKNSTIYICAHPLDGNKRWIPANAVNAVAGTETELLAPLKKGEKFLTVKNAAKWDLKNRGEIHFNAKYDLSDLPNRNTLKTTAKSTSFKDGKWVIELNAPTTVDLPVGTVIRQSKAGGYYNLLHAGVKDEKVYTVTVSGRSLLPEKGKWWPGIRYIQLQILVNWSAGESSHKTEIKNIIFETATTGKKNSKKEFPKMKENIQQLSDLAGKLHLPYAVVAEYIQGSRELQHGKGVFGTPLKIAGKVYDYGFGTHAEGFIKLRFSQPIVRFRAVAGMEDCRFTRHSKHYVCPMKFSIRSAGKELAASAPLTVDDQHFFDLKLPEVTELELHIDIDGKLSNHFANWGNVEAVTAGGEVIKIGRPGIVPKLPIDFEYDGIPAQQWFNA